MADALRSLRGPRLEFIFSSELLPPSLVVLREPRARGRLELAAEILAAHGLRLSVVRPGLYAVVRASQAPAYGDIVGQVLDAASGRPIAGVRIEALPLRQVGWTGDNGEFAIRAVPEGQYTLRVRAPDYADADLPWTVTRDATGPVDLKLEGSTAALDEIVVTTSRYGLVLAPAAAVTLAGADLATQPGLGEDALRALSRLPGMAQSGLSARANIRGGEAGDVLIRLDGFTLRQAFHMPGYQGVFGVMDPGVVREVEVYTGGFPAQYGNRMAGVFDLRTVEPGDAPRRALGLSLLNATARHGGSYERFGMGWVAAGRIGTVRPLLKALAPEAGSPSYADGYARVQFGDPAALRVSGNVLWARDELNISYEQSGEQAQIESLSRYLWLRADRSWDSGIEASLWVGNSLVDSARHGTVTQPAIVTGALSDNRAAEFWDVRAQFDWRSDDRHWLQAGIEWTEEGAKYRYRAQASFSPAATTLAGRDAELLREIDTDQERNRLTAFVTHRWRLTDALVSELGLRAQRTLTTRTSSEVLYDPRVSLRWQVAPQTNLRLHWGRFHQTDEAHELKVEDGQTTFPRAQHSEHLIVGLEQRLADGLALRLEGFRKHQPAPRPRFENLFTTLSLLPELGPDRVSLAPYEAEIAGIELTLSLEQSRARHWLSVSWSDAVEAFAGRDVARSWDQTWAAVAGTDWTRGPWRFGAVAAAHGGWPTTALDSGTAGPRNARRLPFYASLDLRAEYLRPLSVGSLRVALDLTNSLNRNNTCCSDLTVTSLPGGTQVIDTVPRSWLPLVPYLSVLWEF